MIPNTPGIGAYITAHAKLIIAIVTVALPQFVNGDTADWIIAVVGLILIGGVPNNQDAIAAIYKRPASVRERGMIGIEAAIVILILVVAVVVLLSAIR